jgi:hypothetical protein
VTIINAPNGEKRTGTVSGNYFMGDRFDWLAANLFCRSMGSLFGYWDNDGDYNYTATK